MDTLTLIEKQLQGKLEERGYIGEFFKQGKTKEANKLIGILSDKCLDCDINYSEIWEESLSFELVISLPDISERARIRVSKLLKYFTLYWGVFDETASSLSFHTSPTTSEWQTRISSLISLMEKEGYHYLDWTKDSDVLNTPLDIPFNPRQNNKNTVFDLLFYSDDISYTLQTSETKEKGTDITLPPEPNEKIS